MTALFIILAYAVAGALWRRWMGGWGGGKRWWRLAALPILCAPAWAIDPAAWAVLTLWLVIFWTPGHDWTRLGPLVARYGPVGLCWWVAQRAMTGPAFDRLWDFGRRHLKGAIDGPLALSEMAAGAIVFGGLAAVARLG